MTYHIFACFFFLSLVFQCHTMNTVFFSLAIMWPLMAIRFTRRGQSFQHWRSVRFRVDTDRRANQFQLCAVESDISPRTPQILAFFVSTLLFCFSSRVVFNLHHVVLLHFYRLQNINCSAARLAPSPSRPLRAPLRLCPKVVQSLVCRK